MRSLALVPKMSPNPPLADFVAYCQKHLRGDEKGEAQIFLDRLFTAFGYAEGLKGAGASCEFRIKNEAWRGTFFADLVWKPRVLGNGGILTED